MALADLIIGAESGGNPLARNSRSSAGGASQFIDSTWLSMLSKYRPDLARLPREQQLALKYDASPQGQALQRNMTDAYAQENAAYLRNKGHPDTPGNTYLAHFAGPAGAVAVLGASPDKKAVDILGPAAAKANPFLANMTAGDLRAWANSKMGAPIPPASIPAPQQGIPQPRQGGLMGVLAQNAPQSPQGGALALFPQGAPQQPPSDVSAQARLPQPSGQGPAPSIWDMLGAGSGQAPNLPLFASQQGPQGLDPALAAWFQRQNTMGG